MSLSDLFHRPKTVPVELYNMAMTRATELMDANKRLQSQVDDLTKELKAMREDYVKLARERQAPAREVTSEDIARRLGVPLSLVDHIDLPRLGIQVKQERH